MADDESLEARVEMLEMAVASALSESARNRYEIRALQTMLMALIDSFRSGEPERAAEWLDAMQYVATQNAGLTIDLAGDAMVRDHGADPEMIEALEDERAHVVDLLENLYAALKNPKGGMVRD